ncbi:MAG: cytidylate kinase-like family protein [Gemmatimonadota bacterium]|nr:cytidylate kinase-like family protein [Gemmatimonadota bacterium]
MAVITISRQYGSGGSDIAKLVAEQLGWTLIDNEFVDRVAAHAGCTTEEVQQQEERVPTLIERLARALTVSAPEMFAAAADPQVALPPEDRIVRMTETVIAEAVQQGNVVMVGRGAQAYLAEREGTLHVYVVAPRAQRVTAISRRLEVTPEHAERTLDDVDEGRRRYVRTHYDRSWDDAAGYDLCVNTGHFTFETAAGLIVEAARRRGLDRPTSVA